MDLRIFVEQGLSIHNPEIAEAVMENFRRELVRKGDFLIVSGERHQAISFLLMGGKSRIALLFIPEMC